MKTLVIAIDYDETFTSDIDAWTEVIYVLQKYQHVIHCVSYRIDNDIMRQEVESMLPKGVEAFLTGGRQKREYMEDVINVDVNIWIDDLPEAIPSFKDMELMLGD